MRTRFTINAKGELESREGRILGKVVGITLEEPDSVGDTGGSSSSSNDLGGQQALDVDVGSTEALVARAREEGEPAAIERIWATYVEVMEPRNTGLDPETRKIIREALKVATATECQDAIRGCKASSFHMGENDRRKKYNRISQILKGKRAIRTTREQIDMFLDILGESGLKSGLPSERDERVRSAKRTLMDAVDFPDDASVQERAEEAREWLVEQGWQIEYEVGGSPILIEPIE